MRAVGCVHACMRARARARVCVGGYRRQATDSRSRSTGYRWLRPRLNRRPGMGSHLPAGHDILSQLQWSSWDESTKGAIFVVGHFCCRPFLLSAIVAVGHFLLSAIFVVGHCCCRPLLLSAIGVFRLPSLCGLVLQAWYCRLGCAAMGRVVVS